MPGATDEWVAPTDPVEGLRTGIAVAVRIAGIVAGLASHILVEERTGAHRSPTGGWAEPCTTLEAGESRNPGGGKRIEEWVEVAAGTPAALLTCNTSVAGVEAAAGTPAAPLPCSIFVAAPFVVGDIVK